MPGRQFFQIPGPTNLPDRVMRAMERQLINHRGRDMPGLLDDIIKRLKPLFGSERGRIALFPGSGAGSMEAAIVNTVNAGDRVLAFSCGYFGDLFAAIATSASVTTPRRFYDWQPVFDTLDSEGFLPTTPPTSLLFGMQEALTMLVDEEGLPNVFARHHRLAEAVRQAVAALDLGIVCREPARASNTVTGVLMPDGLDAKAVI